MIRQISKARARRAIIGSAAAAVVISAGAAAASRTIEGARYSGHTSQDNAFTSNRHPTVSFKVNSEGTRIIHLNVQRVAYDPGFCNTPDDQSITSKQIPKIVIDKSGHFSGHGGETSGNAKLGDTINGKFVSPDKVVGHIRSKVSLYGCDTGRITFNAKRRGGTEDDARH
jgi:hypothetical protein